MDYCLLNKLQAVQNAAARVTTETRTYDHIRPVLRGLHWLPVHKRIMCKTAVMVYKCLHGMAPPYMAVDCVPVTSMASRRHLQSAVSCCLVVTGMNISLGTQNFAVTGASLGQFAGWSVTPNTVNRDIWAETEIYLDFNCNECSWGFLFWALQIYWLMLLLLVASAQIWHVLYKGSRFTQFYLPPNTSLTCIYSPAAEHHHSLAVTCCSYPLRDGQGELTMVVC